MTRSILLCGITWDQTKLMFAPDKHDEMVAKVKAGLEESRHKMEQAGVDYEMVHYSPDEGMKRWAELITKKRWDGIMIGSGIRVAYPQLAEDMINTVIAHAPHSKILFNKTPGDAYETAQRYFSDM